MRILIRDILNWIIKIKYKGLTIKRGANISGSHFECYNSIGIRTMFVSSFMGSCSYIGSDSILIKTRVGRFCSIGSNVKIVIGNHPTKDWVSTHPVFFSTAKQCGISFVDKQLFEERKFIREGFYLIIENDVWIGDNVTILPGITIGNGSIIAAGTVVTKDVPPYSIIGGNPGRIIRYRFDDAEIAFLQKIKWWNFNFDTIRSLSPSFSDYYSFKNALQERDNV